MNVDQPLFAVLFHFAQIFRSSFNIFWKIIFITNFPFLNSFTKPHYPLKGNVRFVKNTTFGLRKNDSWTLKKCFAKYQWTHVRLSPLCYLANLFTLKRCFILRVIRNIFLALMFFNTYNKGIATKLAEKMGQERPAGQPFRNPHTALVWLYLTLYLNSFIYILYLNIFYLYLNLITVKNRWGFVTFLLLSIWDYLEKTILRLVFVYQFH